MQIPLSQIVPNPEQPRKVFDETDLQSLAESIKANGVIVAVTVEDTGEGYYILHDGERRVMAARLAGLEVIPATITPSLNGTGTLPGKRWANWRVKRSDALRLRLLLPGVYRDTRWTDRGDAFLLAAFAVGLSISDVDRLIGRENVHSRTYRRAQFYLDRLKKTGKIPQVIQKYKLPIRYDPERKLLLADWRDHSDKFPRLAQAVDRFWQGTTDKGDLRKVSGILAAWANWYARTDDQREFARKLIAYSNPSWQGLLHRYWVIRDWGVDPLGRGNVLEEEQNDDRQ